jgi:Tfp pilus assembly protein PilF
MEVAVLASISRFRCGLPVFVVTIAIASFLAGCAEPLTYSRDFKQEGMQQYNSGAYVDASGSFRAAAKQDPTDYHTQYYLGLSYEKTGEPQKAAEAYILCLKLRTQTPAGRFDRDMRERAMNRLAAVIARGDFADPEIDAIQKEADAQKSPDDYRLMARIFALRGDADTAVDNYRRAMSYADHDFTLTKEYALYLLKINQTAEGTRVLKLAWQMDPSDRQVATTLRNLGVTDAQLNVSDQRIEEQAAATTPPQSAWDADTAPRD